jgi:hypothetical protein
MSSHSPKYAEKKRKKILGLLILFLLCITAVLVTFIFLMRSSFLQINTVSIEGSTLVPKEAIEAKALSALSGNYFKVIPLSNIIFFPKSKIKKILSDNFKDIKDFSIFRSGLSSITISIAERVPIAIVCSGFRDETSSGDCYWSDARGYVFGSVDPSATSFSDTTYDHYYVPTDKGDITPGKNFLEEKRFKDLENFTHGAEKGGLNPLAILIGDSGEYEMYMKNKIGDSEMTVYFDDRRPFDSTLSNLLTFWQNTFDTRKATSTPVFDYINLRFGNTIYYSTQ